jgi:hypothetical protein
MNHKSLLIVCLIFCSVAPGRFGTTARAEVLDHQALLDRETFWSNRDFDWYKANIPFFDSPDRDINTTYYYRWELVTRHLTYGSPNTGYLFTEFANRPFWSGAYGAIACPSGHQIYETRWLRDGRYVQDYLKYWFRTPGAQPRNYSSWLADSAWATHRVHPDRRFIIDLLPDLEAHVAAWRQRQWIETEGMFWQLGHDDGMEFDINARQTRDILRGGPSFRPSFNSYMWADALAIARIAALAGDADKADEYRRHADLVKRQVQGRLWDPKRQFFFPMSTRQEEDADGNVVEKHRLTYQSGKHAGSPHGRELHGYVPWAFELPDAGYEDAWKFLMDPEFFYADFGPTTVERNDPMFLLERGCCWWSGQSWPFATTQTLKAMANVLQHYQQDHVTRDDYVKLLGVFARSQRKDGKPYIAEALDPFTGSWEGHDMSNRSEHYFHSGFNDLVITGLAGVRPSDDDTLVIDPLVPDSWDYFALDNLRYRGHDLSIVWDRDGEHYRRGAGLRVSVDGKLLASSDTLTRLSVELPPAIEIDRPNEIRFNYAVNNDGDYFPRLSASHVAPGTSLAQVQDGQYRYDLQPPSRWTAAGSVNPSDWLAIDFGTLRPIDTVKVFLVDQGDGVDAPDRFDLEYFDGERWQTVPDQRREPEQPAGGRPNIVRFPAVRLEKLRVVFQHSESGKAGVTELEAWGEGTAPYQPASPPSGNIAFAASGQDYPKATASHSDRFGGTPENAIDGRIIFAPNPVNRWTSYESPHRTDWLEVDFGKTQSAGRVVLHIYDDGGGVQKPESYAVQYWNGSQWQDVTATSQDPPRPTGDMANTITFDRVETTKIRVVFTHSLPAKSGVTEIEVWAD